MLLELITEEFWFFKFDEIPCIILDMILYNLLTFWILISYKDDMNSKNGF